MFHLPKIPAPIWIGLAALLLGAALLFAIDRYGDSRERAGVEKTDAAWKAASDKLIEEAATAADAATRTQAPKIAAQAARAEEEKERIDAAIENGTSPVDALFPVADGVR